jgi:transcriptional regulator of arginine metabolism|tara:strand:- start:500 stop:961 length:462 start_codon:yes stop_codon:yes gene_type:complete
MTNKSQRQHLIERLLADRSVGDHGELVELLALEGVEASQASVSRDLDELGAVKLRAGGRTVYAIPEIATQRSIPLETLRRVCGDWVVGAEHSENLVVLTTPPGSAHVVASAIDRSDSSDVIGTVAGDDTILVVAARHTSGEAVAKRFRELAGL